MQENNNQLNVEELAEQLKDELVAPSIGYSSAKLAYVTFTDGRKKVKLRKWIADKAKLLQKLNGFPYSKNRTDLIEAYDIGGLKGIQLLIDEEVDMAIKKRQKLLEQKKDELQGKINQTTTS